jgi:hypothetical protein
VVPFQNSTELLMPLSPNKLLFSSGRISSSPGVSTSRKSLLAAEVQNVNIFSSNEELLKEVHDRNPIFDGKIVAIEGSEYSYFPYPPGLPQTFRQ